LIDEIATVNSNTIVVLNVSQPVARRGWTK